MSTFTPDPDSRQPITLTALPTLPPPPLLTIPSSAAPDSRQPTADSFPHSALGTRNSKLTPFLIGRSTQGRDILAWRLGTGERILLIVGGIHTGFETNTVTLVNELIAHFEGAPAEILPGVSLIFIPVANPDGLTLGRELDGRFNANEVDLNRNWGCEWSAEAYFQDQRVNAGTQAFSEPETQALSVFIRQIQPSAVIFYHSAADGIFAGNCGGDHGSAALAAVLGEATGYSYGKPFTAYRVTGTAASWVDGQGIPAVDLELTSSQETQFERNLKGIIAVQFWLAAN